ncbi:MAG: hypothetical protein AB1725_10705, partial [Armatimonadota bacterium]
MARCIAFPLGLLLVAAGCTRGAVEPGDATRTRSDVPSASLAGEHDRQEALTRADAQANEAPEQQIEPTAQGSIRLRMAWEAEYSGIRHLREIVPILLLPDPSKGVIIKPSDLSPDLYLFDPKRLSWERIGEHLYPQAFNTDLNYIYLVARRPMRDEQFKPSLGQFGIAVYSLRAGRIVNEFDLPPGVRPVGVGRVLVAGSSTTRQTLFYNSLTGRVAAAQEPTSHATPLLAWDSARLRIFLTDTREGVDRIDAWAVAVRGLPHSSTVRVIDSHGAGLWGYDKVIGNPEAGPFAVQHSFVGAGVESYIFNVFRADLTPSPVQCGRVYDVSRHGVLGSPDRGYPNAPKDRFPALQCFDAGSGRLLWQKEAYADTPAFWVRGRAVLLSNSELHFLDAQDGTLLHREPIDGAFRIAVRGNWILVDT